MKTEAKELYNYITTVEPLFMSRYEFLSTKMVSLKIATRTLVREAIEQYAKVYGNGNGKEIFSQSDFIEVVEQIYKDVLERDGNQNIDEYTMENVLRYAETYQIFDPNEITEWRKPTNGVEAEGVLWMASKWLSEKFDWETMENAYDNIHGWRDNINGGSFNIDEGYQLYDIKEVLEIDDVILCGNCVYLDVRNTETDKAVAYIRIN